MAITDQLKALYVKLGGDPNTGASNIEEWIDKIEDVAASGSGSGSGGVVFVEMGLNTETNKLEIRMAAGELLELISNGNIVRCRIELENNGEVNKQYFDISTAYYSGTSGEGYAFCITSVIGYEVYGTEDANGYPTPVGAPSPPAPNSPI